MSSKWRAKEADFNRGVGSRAEHVRQLLGLTRIEVAKSVGTTVQSVLNYEKGHTPIKASTLRRLCELYHITPEWLLGMSNELNIFGSIGGEFFDIREQCKPICTPDGEDGGPWPTS